MSGTPAWITLHLEVTTPLFNGGADPVDKDGLRPEDEAGIRPASLRGAMRFWFRALAGIVTGPDLRLLARIEHEVFGHTDHASPVRLRIPRQPEVTPPRGQHAFLPRRGAATREQEQDARWIIYLLGQGLGNMQELSVSRPYVAPGQEFDLRLGFARRDAEGQAIAALAIAALWLACAYGGAGGRVRRGFGGLRITGAEGWLPDPWDAASVCSPDLHHYQSLPRHGERESFRCLWPAGAAGQCMTHLKPLLERNGAAFAMAAWAQPPPFPVLSRTRTLAGTSGGKPFPGWAAVASYAGEQLRRFRASEDYPGARYQPKIKTPEWATVIHGAETRFGLGALGLPVVYKDGNIVNAERGASTPLRRASPLWLRPVGGAEGWRLLSFAFCDAFLPGPDAPAVALRRHGSPPRQVAVRDDDVVRSASAWISGLADDKWFRAGDRPA